MVWIRRVRTASGATAVQIAESVDGRRRIVRHVGSARDDAELGLLIEEARRWHGELFTDGQVIDTITPRDQRGTAAKNSDPKIRAEPVWDRTTHPKSWRAVWAYSSKRAVRDSKTLNLHENKARAVVAGDKTARTPRFVTVRDGARELDEASLQRARRLVGLKGYVTNIDVTQMPATEVIASYHDL